NECIVVLSTVFTFLVLLVNSFLLFLMTKHTPHSFANFGLVLKFHVINDISTIIAAFAVMNRSIPVDDSFIYISHGHCGWISSTACYLSYGHMTMGGSMTIYIVLVSFIVRLRIAQDRRTSKLSICFFLTVATVPVPLAIFV
ncbi:hypothetical protein PFISCL1PPCAC_14086, partial [Pristionchus fissidentatus]